MAKPQKIHDQVSCLEVLCADPPLKQNFLELHRLHLRNHYANGEVSEPYTYETVLRKNLDAVAILLFEESDPETIYLRRTLRPAVAIREYVAKKAKPGLLDLEQNPVLLEVVAGLLEESDTGEIGIQERGVAEIWEEAGFQTHSKDLISLGHAITPTPGMNPEQIYLFACPIEFKNKQSPPGDGSVVEEVGGIISMVISQAIEACLKGVILDAKTEICLHRYQKIRNQTETAS